MSRKTTIAAVVAAALIAVGCSSGGGDKNATDPAPAGTARVGASAQPPAAVTGAGTLTTRDVKLTVKTTSKQCFGSAGCSVDWTIVPAVDTAKLGDRDVLITYEVRGVEDGPQIGSFTLGADGSYSSDEVKGFGQTKSKSAKLTAVATAVE
jgi:hypothetical protein